MKQFGNKIYLWRCR